MPGLRDRNSIFPVAGPENLPSEGAPRPIPCCFHGNAPSTGRSLATGAAKSGSRGTTGPLFGRKVNAPKTAPAAVSTRNRMKCHGSMKGRSVPGSISARTAAGGLSQSNCGTSGRSRTGRLHAAAEAEPRKAPAKAPDAVVNPGWRHLSQSNTENQSTGQQASCAAFHGSRCRMGKTHKRPAKINQAWVAGDICPSMLRPPVHQPYKTTGSGR